MFVAHLLFLSSLLLLPVFSLIVTTFKLLMWCINKGKKKNEDKEEEGDSECVFFVFLNTLPLISVTRRISLVITLTQFKLVCFYSIFAACDGLKTLGVIGAPE